MKKSHLLISYVMCFAIVSIMSQCRPDTATSSLVATDKNADKSHVRIDVIEAIEKATDEEIVVEVDNSDILYFEFHEASPLGEFDIKDIAENRILLQSANSLFIYEIPSGKFVRKLSKRGNGSDEYRSISAAVMTPDDNIAVIESQWQDSSSKVMFYDSIQQMIGQISIPFIGDMTRLHQGEGYVASKANSYTGGNSKIYHINDGFELIDSLDCRKHYAPGATFYGWVPIDGLSAEPTIILRDTIFRISSDFRLLPTLVLTYGDKRMPENFSRKNYDSYEKYLKDYGSFIIPTQLQKLGNKVWARLEHDNKVYYCIWDAGTSKLQHSLKATNMRWGITLRIGDETLHQWPIGEWDGTLIFYIPDYITTELTDNEDSNPGLVFIPIDKITALSQ